MRTLLAAVSLSLIACGGMGQPENETPTEETVIDSGVTEPEQDEREPEDPPDAGEETSVDEEIDAGAIVIADAGVTTDAGTPPPPDHRAFRVMSWNVRGPLDTGAHAWPNRRANVIALIKRQSPDVVGVQEAQVTNGQDIPADLIAGLQSEYGYYRPSGGSPKIIFYKKTRFTRFAQGNEPLPNPYASSHVCADRSSGKKLAWVTLRDRLTDKAYFIGNTHLAFSDACGLGRLRQAEEIKRLVELRAGSLSAIVLGDFNTDDQKPSLANEGVVEVMEGTGRTLFRTSRHDGNTGADDATFNSRWNGSGTNNARIDFIFHSGRDITSAAPSVDRWPDTDTGTPSDHFPILATIRGATFEPGSTLVQVRDGENADTQLFFADVDGDGCADQLSWSVTLSSTWWAKSRCNGTFAAPSELGGATSGVASTRFFFADVTGDGCADKIYWRPTYDSGRVRIYRGRCDGTFEAVTIANVPASASETTQFFFANVTADACADLVRWSPTENSGRVTVYASTCDGTVGFTAATSGAGGAQTITNTRLWFADVDGDRRDDLIAWHPQTSSGQTRVFKADGNGSFTSLFTHSVGSSGVDTSRFAFADVDGDGLADKVFWRPTFRNGRAQIYPGIGTNFASSPLMDNTGWSQSENTTFLYADTDGDGAADKTYWNPGSNGGASKVFRSRH